MKYISLVLVVATFGFACSSEPANKPVNSTTNKPSAATPANPASPMSGTPAPAAPNVSQIPATGPIPEGTPVAVAEVDPNQQVAAADPSVTGRRRIVDVPQSGPLPPPKRVPAGENSEMTTTMDKSNRFVETRYFKSHPQIVKAEKVFLDASNSVVSITLKNGKQLNFPGDRIPNMLQATSVDLLRAAGVNVGGSDPSSTGARQ